ncbi:MULTISPECIES: SDR family oxidoreductase [unclassified Corallococcus]|uniref:SDR family oxidoreductase n=1 Tax=unclassified Corallococcus TaxID=2685029 RepID=UPI001A8FE78A|nr:MULTISPECIES: SDR family oxidoreductase [unclassified Corallococcus]MBN9681813.1 SDR family oxidoreductase [Corallococcus sp. NCSPR001]WAS86617.1 SDR family oxidoreductase [Corallococcus sp. NCRR]
MFVITGATGRLGRFVVEGVLKQVPAHQVAVAVRHPDKAAEWAARGVQVRNADYSRPETWDGVFSSGDTVLLISSSEVGQRRKQHQTVVDAAKKAGVKLLAYTSILHADTSRMILAGEHLYTEEAIRASGLPFVFLRHGWYLENYTEAAKRTLEQGVLRGCAKDGRVAPATRQDYAAAAVAVLTGTGHENQVYELAGDTGFTLAEYAAELSRQSGRTVTYQDLPPADFAAALQQAGLPKGYADVLANSDEGIARGDLNDTSRTLSRLIGHPTTALAEALKQG